MNRVNRVNTVNLLGIVVLYYLHYQRIIVSRRKFCRDKNVLQINVEERVAQKVQLFIWILKFPFFLCNYSRHKAFFGNIAHVACSWSMVKVPGLFLTLQELG